MNVLIVGNGLAGTMAAKTVRESDPRAAISIFAAESFPYYPRPNLIEYVAGRLPFEKLFAYSEGWHAERGIDLRLGQPVRRVDPAAREIELADGSRVPYDKLLLAEGATAAVLPLKGAGKSGVLTLRTIDDAHVLLDRLRAGPRVAICGGGLLGLEIARAVRGRGVEVEVAEIFPYLLPRQLDPPGAEILKAQLEAMGVRVRLGVSTEEVLGDGGVAGLRFKDGSVLEAGLVLMAAGIRPNVALAREAGASVDGGVVVDDRMATTLPDVYAAGDGTRHRGRLYGIIPAAFDQARVAAENILGGDRAYGGTVPSTTLKIAGLALTSAGTVDAEGEGIEEFRLARPEAGLYKKIVLRDGVLVGAVWMGTKTGAAAVAKAVAERKNAARWKAALLEDGFDFSLL